MGIYTFRSVHSGGELRQPFDLFLWVFLFPSRKFEGKSFGLNGSGIVAPLLMCPYSKVSWKYKPFGLATSAKCYRYILKFRLVMSGGVKEYFLCPAVVPTPLAREVPIHVVFNSIVGICLWISELQFEETRPNLTNKENHKGKSINVRKVDPLSSKICQREIHSAC